MAHCTDPTHTERRPNNGGKHGTVCVTCARTSGRAKAKRHLAKLKDQVYEHYGNACNCCGVTERVFLAIDHINDDGAEHRRATGTRGITSIYRFIIRAGYPDTFQILCHNCNYAKRFGPCPHVMTAGQFATLL